MTAGPDSKYGKAQHQFTGTRASSIKDFPGEFAKLKLTAIRPALENIGNRHCRNPPLLASPSTALRVQMPPRRMLPP